uniref:Uncharacterized protein n=1 Tax=Lepeophtheirus salmonis TaxID=72036 RepID=A0A0K2UIJ8_LEPSM
MAEMESSNLHIWTAKQHSVFSLLPSFIGVLWTILESQTS